MSIRQDNILFDSNDKLESDILSYLQSGLSLGLSPFSDLAEILNVSFDQVKNCIDNLFQTSILREITPVFNADKLGYGSSLIAASVPVDYVDSFVKEINSMPGVSHNYGRNHKYNIWFTLALPVIAAGGDPFAEVLRSLAAKYPLDDIVSLPVEKMYKLKVRFGTGANPVFLNNTSSNNTFGGTDIQSHSWREGFSQLHKALIRRLQTGIPVEVYPYKQIAEDVSSLGIGVIDQQEISELLVSWHRSGIIRRIAGRVRHNNLGYSSNAMVVMEMASDEIEAAARKIASNDFVSHCYHRKRGKLWSFDLYAMVHAKDDRELQHYISEIISQGSPTRSDVLNTACEYKKQSVQYFC